MRIAGFYRVASKVVLGNLPGGGKHCVVCDSRVWRFLPYRRGSSSLPPLMISLDVIGSDVDNYACPKCASHDRERHLFYFMNTLGIFERMQDSSVLHFAPELHLANRIVASGPANYLQGDLYPDSPAVQKLDLLSLPFDDDSFDFVIANHVLEHVSDDRGALREIFRVLTPGGLAILQTPFSGQLEKTWEDPGIESEQARLQAYGQEDHVRLYAKDIFQRFTEFGLISRVAGHTSVLAGVDARKEGLNVREPFFLFQKPGSAGS